MAGARLVRANRAAARAVTTGFCRIEAAVVGTYTKIEDAFIDRYLTREGESTARAKERLKQESREREGR
ncbi:hypothetical protein AAEU42_07120 [Pseudoflavonifractor phocaeensis]|uniref:hypothetical protein n=1 Tax=Pseudoflavonifractor phocaeensis TaxID=1870988 RepID=UPI00313CC75C